MEAVAHENYKRSAPERAKILACAIAPAKKVVVSESREIAWVAYLAQITIIRSSRARKLWKERSWNGQDIIVCE